MSATMPVREKSAWVVKNVLVVGGGIAGMSAAIELRKGGVAVDLIEADPEWRVYGAGITLSAPSLRAFQRIGVLEAILEQGAASDWLICSCQWDADRVVSGVACRRPPPPPPPPPLVHRGERRDHSTRFFFFFFFFARAHSRGCEGGVGDAPFDLARSIRISVVTRWRGMTSSSELMDLVSGSGCWCFRMRRSLVIRVRCAGGLLFRASAERQRAAMYIGGQIKAGLVPISRDEMYLFFLETRETPEHIDPSQWPELLRPA